MQYFKGEDYFNKDTDLYVFIGKRSIGKTYWGIHFALDEWIKHKKGFAWVFGTEVEMKDFKTEIKYYLSELSNEFRDFTIVGDEVCEIQYEHGERGKKIVANRIFFGKLGSLNTSNRFKNNQYIRYLFYDEVSQLGTNGNKKSFRDFLRICGSMERDKEDFKIFCFMNAVSKNNPIFIGLDITYEDKEIIELPELRTRVITLPVDKYGGKKRNTITAVLAQADPEYAKMAYENIFNFDNDNFIDHNRRNEVVMPLYTVYLNNEKYSVYFNIDNKIYFDWYKDHFLGDGKVIHLSTADFLLYKGNKDQDSDREYDIIFEKWEYAMRTDNIRFKTYDIRNAIITFLSARKVKYE